MLYAVHPGGRRAPAEREGAATAPETVEVVDAIPLTAVGEHDRPALRRRYAAATA